MVKANTMSVIESSSKRPADKKPKVVIVGGGMAGLSAAKALKKAPVDVLLIDRTNHHLFQPLLYQVATAVLTPAQIAAPLRSVMRGHKNVTTLLGEVSGVDTERKVVFVSDADRQAVPVGYDYLVLATGVSHSYFGHNEFERFAPGLKSLADAVHIRNRILQAFEQAEAEEDPRSHRDLLTFVLVGAGPTGVEMAGAISMLIRKSLRKEFRRIDPKSARVVLIDAADRVLPPFAADISQAAKQRLESLGVEIRLGHPADKIDEDGLTIGGERIASKCVIWTAGVAPSPAGKWLGAPMDRAGRVRVRPDLTVPNHPEIFVVGDTASLDHDGKPLPGVAQVAIQQGRYAGRVVRARVSGKTIPAPFRYFDKGSMAVVGQGYAVVQSGRLHLKGLFAFFVWAFIHVTYLAEARLRLSVFAEWAWTYLTRQRGSLLIVNRPPPRLVAPVPSEAARQVNVPPGEKVGAPAHVVVTSVATGK